MKLKQKINNWWSKNEGTILAFGTIFVVSASFGYVTGTCYNEGYKVGSAVAKNEMYEMLFNTMTESRGLPEL